MEHQQALKEAAEVGDINGLYSCIKEDPHILDVIDKIPFVDTPLHTAASAGHHLFALEMLRLKPSFGRKLNPDGLSPLDLALRNGHYGTVIRLLNIDMELLRVKGREGLTPLHYAAETNQIDFLAEFLFACPASIEDKTIRAETALHIAVKNFKPEAFKVLLGWLRRTHRLEKMLKLKDDEGNNVLHIAVSTSQPEIVKLLVERTRMNKNAKNWEGLTALDIAVKLGPGPAKIKIENILRGARVLESSSLRNNNNHNIYSPADFLMSPQGFLEAVLGGMLHVRSSLSLEKPYLNIVLVVAVLLATATYQAVLSPPGGVIDHNNAANNLLPTNVTIMSTTTNLPVPGGGGNISSHIINATICPTSSSTTSDDPSNRVLFRNHKGKPIAYYKDNFYGFYILNTSTFMFSITIIISILLSRPFGFLLQAPLGFLAMSYGLSFVFISPSYSYARISFFVASTCTLCIPSAYAISTSFFLGSGLQRKRLRMLHRCFMN